MDSINNDESTTSNLDQQICNGGVFPKPWLVWVVGVIMMLFVVIIWCGNGLVILVFLRSPNLRTMTNFYIMQLAVADFGLGLALIFNIVVQAKPETVLENDVVCAFKYALYQMFCAASIFGLAALTHDRYLAITDPLRYHDVMTRKRYVVSGCVIWIPAIIVGFVVPCSWHRSLGSCPNCTIPNILERDYYRYIVVPGFTVVSLFMFVLYMRIFSIARYQIKSIADLNMGTQGPGEQSKKNSLQKQMKLIKVGLTVFAAFYICFLPFFITISIQMYLGIYNDPLVDIIRPLTASILSINSCINPIIYTYKLPAFKMELKNFLGIKTTVKQINVK